MTPEQMQKINASRMADTIMANLRPFLDSERGKIVSRIKSMYRCGEFTEAKFVACAASLCVLDDLENQLAGVYNRGQKLSEELYNEEIGRD